MFLCVIIIGISDFIDSFLNLSKFLPNNGDYLTIADMPSDTAWILVGNLHENRSKYIRGPFFSIVSSNYDEESLIPRKGELIKTKAERNLIIVNFKEKGVIDLLREPWKEGVLEDKDYTGIKIKSGTIAEVRGC